MDGAARLGMISIGVRLLVSAAFVGAMQAPALADPWLRSSITAQVDAGPFGNPQSKTDHLNGQPSFESSLPEEVMQPAVLSDPRDPDASQPVDWDAKAQEVTSVAAGYGALHAATSISTSVTPYTVTLEGFDGGGNPFSDTFTTPLAADASSTATALAVDDITVVSGSLPAGTLVDLKVTFNLDGTIAPGPPSMVGGFVFAPTGSVTAILSAGGGGDFFPGADVELNQPFSETISVPVGDTIEPTISLTIQAEVDAAAGVEGGSPVIDPGGSIAVDASDTAGLFIDPATPGVTLMVASGHDYTTPVPEPGRLGGSAAAVVALFARRRLDRG